MFANIENAVDQCSIYTRTATKLRTKGALAVGFKLFGTSLLFISCHLSHGKSLLLRVKDYRKIVRQLDLRHLNLSGYSAIDKVHGVFWFGDLNFRVGESRFEIEKLITSSDKTREQIIAKLLEKDQLRQEIRNNSTFNGFQEGPVNFLPTYKYDIGCEEFDTSAKQRAPAYTKTATFRLLVVSEQFSDVLSDEMKEASLK
uniref:Inositol polyphosphate-related phosphatase domain-containing protein n=1 Tax=Romanomermis culicivorax TaxID=13658 RepID=A0A915JQC1_ROMCU